MHVQISRRLPARLNESRHSSQLHLRCEASRSRTEPRTNRPPRSRLVEVAAQPLAPSSLRRGFAVSDMLRAAAEHDVAWEEAEQMGAGVYARLFPERG